MNDFTKGELHELFVALRYVREGIEDFIPESPLVAKLEEMIANHCDHDYQYNTYDKTFACTKCLTFYIPKSAENITNE